MSACLLVGIQIVLVTGLITRTCPKRELKLLPNSFADTEFAFPSTLLATVKISKQSPQKIT